MTNFDQLAQAVELSAEQRELLELLLRERRLDVPPAEVIERAAAERPPLSFAQQRLWFLYRLNPESAAYNMPAAVALHGRLAVPALARSLGEVVRRHAVLRTTFAAEEGAPVQWIAPSGRVPLPVVDLESLPTGAGQTEGRRLAREEAGRPFDLTRDLLLRAILMRLEETEHLAVVTLHHISSDGWSIGVLVRELATLYTAFAAGRPSPLPELAIQYGDFARWQREWLRGEVLERQLAYWREQMAGAPAVLDLPADRPRTPVQSLRGGRLTVRLAAGPLESLKALGQAAGATPFMVFLAAFQALLSRSTGKEDLVVGSPIANRNRTETEGLIGFFVNTLALRCDLSGDPEFVDLVERVREVTLGAYSHQDLPFEKLVEDLRLERSAAYSPVFQVLLALQNAPAPLVELHGLTLERSEVDRGTEKFDLTLSLEEDDLGLEGTLSYNRDLFDRTTAERLWAHLKKLLLGGIEAPGRRLSELPLLDAGERQQVLWEWSRAEAVELGEDSIPGRFESCVRRTPDAVAVVAPVGSLTYAELDRRAGRLARRLRSLGIESGEAVGICVERSAEMILSILAVLKAGAAYLPLDPSLPAERLDLLLADAQQGSARPTVLTEQRFLGLLAPFAERGGEAVALDGPDRDGAGRSGTDFHRAAGPESLAYVIYTSGSTGLPKGVAVEQRGVLRLVAPSRWMRFGPEEVFLQLAPAAFDASTLEIWGALLHGGRLVVPSAHRPSLVELGEWIARWSVTTLWLTAGLFHEMVASDIGALASLSQLLTGGDVVSPEAARRVARELPGIRLINGYGPTEGTTFTCCEPVAEGGAARATVPIGRPITNTTVYIVDRQGRPAAIGVPGELLTGGDGLARGYLGQPALTAERFIPDPFSELSGERLYRTGDLARHLSDGRIEFLGRLDRQVKVRGFRIEPGEVEAALAEHADVAQVCVTTREARGSRAIVAYLVPREGASPSPAGLRAYLRLSLPEYMIPVAFVVLAAMPLTANGKVDWRALPEPELESREAQGGEPSVLRGPVEEMLAGIWSDLLGLPGLPGPEDDFFALGGHSLLAMRLMARIATAFDVDLPVSAVFEASTLAGLGAAIEPRLGRAAATVAPPLRPGLRQGEPPLSYGQERLWFLDQLEPGGAVYNIPTAVRLRGRLSVTALATSLAEVVRRHEVLRSTLQVREGQPVQVIAPVLAPALPLIDLSGIAPAAREERALRLAEAETRWSFDLAHGPLLRALLLRLDATDHLVMLVLHHIVADGWSMGVLAAELSALYAAALEGRRSPLPELPVQYADFALWQRSWLAGEVLNRELTWWREQLAGAPARLELFGDRPRPTVRSGRGGTRPFSFTPELSAALVDRGRQRGATPFMALLAGFAALLHRYTGEEAFCVGAPIANRGRAEIESLIGFFVNTQVLPLDLTGVPSWEVLLARVRETALAAYAHQDLPFEKLVEALLPQRTADVSPLVQVVLALQNAPPAVLALPGLAATPVALHSPGAKFDLAIQITWVAAAFQGVVEYSRDRMDETAAERLVGHFETLLAGAVADPGSRLSELPLLTAAERSQLLAERNRTAAPYRRERPVHVLFAEQAERQPGALALACGPLTLSYGELDRRAERLARRLRALGVGPEVPVAICAERSPALVLGALAVLKAGGTYVPLDPLYPQERLAFMLEDLGRPLLLAEERVLANLPEEVGEPVLLTLTEDESGPLPDLGPAPAALPGQRAYVIYTSGSTGRPKGVEIEHGSLANLVAWHRSTYEVGPGERATLVSAPAFDASVWEIWPYLASGASLHIPAEEIRSSPAALAEWLCEERITLCFLPTPLAEAVLGEPGLSRSCLRALLTGGDRLHHPPRRGLGFALVNHYGPTESTVVATAGVVPPDLADSLPPAIGHPIANIQAHLLDRWGQLVPAGIAGELCIGGDSLARGYWRRPELTAERFVPDAWGETAGGRLYRTGDLARRRPGGALDFLGRIDHQVKVRGFRIELGEIESVLARHPGVSEAAVVVGEGRPGDARLTACLTASGDLPPGPGELRAFLAARLPSYMVPAAFLVLSSLPLTANGKVDRQALSRLQPTDVGDEAELAAPRTPVEELLAGIWADLLGRERVGVGDDFFALGGHSLLATRLASRVREVFAVELPLRRLFEAPTLAGLAQSIEAMLEAGRGTAAPPILPVSHEGPLPLSYPQERLWFLDQFEPGSTALNIPAQLSLKGALAVAALAESLNQVVDRHAILRTTFETADGRPFQRITPPAPVVLPAVDLCGLAEDPRQTELERLAAGHMEHIFDLARGPLLAALLVRLAPQRHSLLLTVHHIIADGWSMSVLVREWQTLYAAQVSGRPAPLAPPRLQYADFAAWQRSQWSEEALALQLGYWRERLAGELPALDLPFDRPRASVQTFRGGSVAAELGGELVTALHALCRREGATPFMALLAGFTALLARQSGQTDLLVGTPVAGRTRAEVEDLVGCFLNTLVLRTDLDDQPSFCALLARVRETCLGAYAHQDLPFERLLTELAPQRDLSRTPLFQVFFNLVNVPRVDLGLPGLEIDLQSLPDAPAKFDLTLYLSERGAGIALQLVYNADLFGGARMEELLRQYELLLRQAVAEPERSLFDLSLVTTAAARVLPDPRAELSAAFAGSVQENLSRWAAQAPSALALADPAESWAYGELEAQANRLGHALLAAGVRQGDVVAVYAHRSAPLVWGLLGVLKAGAVFLLLDPSYPAARQVVMLRLARPRAFLAVTAAGPVPEEIAGELSDLGCIHRLELPARAEGAREGLAAFPPEPPRVEVGPDDPAYLAFTSGSTGAPKGILGRHGSLSHFIPWQRERFGLGAADRFSLLSGLAHDPLHRDIFTPLQLGAAILVPDPERLTAGGWLAGWMEREAITVAHLTPAMGQLLTTDLAAEAMGEVRSLRWVLLVGDVLTRRDAARLRRLAPGVTVVNLYGSTETQRAVGYHEVDPLAGEGGKEILPLGRGIEDVQLLVSNRAGAPAGVGELGEIFVRSPHLALGYLGQPELSRERFLVNPATGLAGDRMYRTGDFGRYLPDGEVEFAGRADQQVKIRGFRVELGEIEATLARHPAVEHAVVLLRDDGGEKYLAAYVVPGPAGRPAVEELRGFLKGQVPAYMVPSAYVLLNELPVTPNRKVDRRALPAPARSGGGEQAVAPRSPEEEVLAAIWAELLGLDRVGVHDNFFDLGGHSLKATQLVSRVRGAFDFELPLRTLFEAPTVAELARRLSAARVAGEGPAPPLLPRRRDGEMALSFAQERLWFLAQMEPDNPSLNLPTAVGLRGTLHPTVLSRSLSEIVRRHEALRTLFATAKGRPVQRVRPSVDPYPALIDLAGLADGKRLAEQERWVAAEAWRPFDLAVGPLLRTRLFRLTGDEHVLLVVFHHIVADGWSLGVFFGELAALYRAFASGEPSPLPDLAVQYADFAQWQREWLAGEAYASRLAYWKRQLAGRPPALELPGDRPRPAVRTFRGARSSAALSRSLAAGLVTLSRAAGSTLFMTLLACFEALLHRDTEEEEILVGSPIAHRNRQEIEPLIGVFFNLLALRSRLSRRLPFRDLLAAVRETALAAYAHQDLPFEKLLEELHPERHLSRTPLFQVVFVLQNAPLAPVALPELTLEPLETQARTSNFDLTLFLGEQAEGLRILVEYKVELFDGSTVARLIQHFATLAEGALRDPGTPLGELPLVSAAERHQLVAEWNDTAAAYPRDVTLNELFERQAALTPESPAVIAPEGSLTYRQLAERAERLCRHLRALGASRGDFVAVCMDRSLDMVPALLGILKTGAAYVPLDPDFPESRLSFILSSLEVRQVVTRSGQLAMLAGLPDLPLLADLIAMDEPAAVQVDGGGTGPRVWTLPPLASLPGAPPAASTADDLAYVIFTSGSTGTPKGVMVRHRPAVNLIRWVNDTFAVGPGDLLLFTTSLCFDLSVYDLFGTLAAGATIRVATSPEVKDPENLVRILTEEPITFWDSAPAALQHLTPFLPASSAVATGPLRLVFLSGDWIPLGLPDRIRQTFPGARVISLGGATEATIWSNFYPYRGLDPHWVSIPYGRPLQNAQYYVLDADLTPCPVGVPGDLYIAGECLSTGYAQAPELTAVKYLPDSLDALPGAGGGRLYRTGDRARFRADGNLEFLGRRDQQVKIRGFRIELGEIEAVLGEHPAVGDAVVLAREDVPGDKRLVAYVTRALRHADDPGAGERQSDQIAHWKMIYDETYRQASANPDPTFNVAGWISSYTGLPIAEEEMREWVEQTVERILARRPRRVLELGCGTGLLLFRVAPTTEEYWGTDISGASLAYIERQLDGRGLPQVRLLERSAEDGSGIPAGAFDAVILNSVTQHFPSADYLKQVIAGAVDRVADGGFVFVGDVRSLPHLRAFHASIQLRRAPDTLGRPQFAAWVEERVEQEEELVVDPAFFLALRRELPRVSRVVVQLQRGRHHNEVTRFRYSAILSVGAPVGTVEAAARDWQAEGLTLSGVRQLLATERPRALVLRRIPNARLDEETRVLSWLREPRVDAPDTLAATLAQLKAELETPSATGGVEPEDLWALGRDLPYEVTVTWSAADPVGCCDVTLQHREAAFLEVVEVVDATAAPATAPVPRAWRDLTNDPLKPSLAGRLAAELRQHLVGRLPEYMVPAAVLVLDSFPLTSNGKLDRRALPAPDAARPQVEAAYVAPRTEVEKRIAEIWSQVLGLERVGVEDHFFELGGHSLLATQAVSRLREVFAVDLSLRALFEAPTIAELARVLESSHGQAEALPLVPVPRVPGAGMPLSFAQERLWFIAQFAPGSTLYNVPMAVRLEGALDTAALGRALEEVVARHEALRTTFAEVDDAPVQIVQATVEMPLPILDLRDLPPAEQIRRADLAAAMEARRPFDLERGPLVRALLVELGGDERRLLLTLHHIVSDGWSIGVLVREVAALYTSFLAGRPSPLPPLAVQYADFANWQRRWLAGEVLADQLGYWREQLGGAERVLQLPTDCPRPAVQTFHGARRLFRLPSSLAALLELRAREEGATLFMVLLAAFQALLLRYTGQEDVSVGTPIANRSRPELEPLIGFFVNTLVLRTRLDGRPSFRLLLARVREVALGAYAHQDLPFEKLLQELHPERDVSHPALFQVLFALQNMEIPRLDLPGLQLSLVTSEAWAANFELSLLLVEAGGELAGGLSYNTDLFDPSTVARLVGHLETLLAGALGDPGRRISELPLLAEGERHELFVEWNEPRVFYGSEGFIHHLFEEQAARHPEEPAVLWGGERLTYGRLNCLADRLAQDLVHRGVGTETLVGICLERSPELVVALLAVLKAGGAFVPLAPEHPEERLASILASTGLGLLLTTSSLRGRLPAFAGEAVVLDDLDAGDLTAMGEESPGPAPAATSGDLAYVMYTSGSTGVPKGVMIPHRGLYNRIAFARAAGQILPGDRFLHKASISFDVSLLEIFLPLAVGGAVVIARPGGHQDPAYLVRLMAAEGVHQAIFPPSLLRAVLEEEEIATCRNLRAVASSAEALPLDLQERFFATLGADLYNRYGPTEASIAVTSWRCERESRERTVPIGRPIAGTEVLVLDASGQPVPPGVAGELLVGGVCLGRGYFQAPDLTAEKFVPHPFSRRPGERLYRTGDLVRFRRDGAIEFLGRIDHQVKIRGVRIELGEVEAALERHPGLREVAVIDRETPAGGRQLVAYVVPRPGEERTPPEGTELRVFLRQRLPEAMVPAAFVFLGSFPLLASGKLDRAALPEPVAEPLQSGPAVALASPLEERIAALWGELLGLASVGREESFFDLGGHSLLVIKVRARLQQALGREIPIVDLFRHPTVATLARHLEQEVDAAPAAVNGRQVEAGRRSEIAIIGMAGRFPGAGSVDAFWRNLCDGVESISFFTDEELTAAGVSPERLRDPHYVRAGGVLDDVELFDADFFGIPPGEAETLDPQHRLFLECAWEALERAGYDPAATGRRIGVFGGSGMNTYLLNVHSPRELIEGGYEAAIGNDKDFLPTRVSYELGLTGPSLAVQTACSTSLAAVHLACQSLSAGESDVALAGGVSIAVPQKAGYLYQQGMILSPDGHCRAFDAGAGGTVRGNGVGIVVLKRLAEAVADGDHIHAVIKGSAVNNDGAEKIGYTAPSAAGQAQVIADALALAGVDPSTVDYVEAHGTGTQLGDPIEIDALTQVFAGGRGGRARRCLIGSVKTNVGHLNSAAGVTGLIKTALMLEHRRLVPSLHFATPNPEIDFAASPFAVSTRLGSWEGNDTPRRAGVSSFGLGGTNVHCVLEEAPTVAVDSGTRPFELLLLSARTPAALDQATADLAGELRRRPDLALADVAFTLQVGRRRFPHRRMLVCGDREDAATALANLDPARVVTGEDTATERPLALLFPGLERHYAGMGRELYRWEPRFRDMIDACADLVRHRLDVDLRDLLLAGALPFASTIHAQVGLFAVEYALARLLLNWGLRPEALLGQGVGELAAACVAGAFPLEEALALLAAGPFDPSHPPFSTLGPLRERFRFSQGLEGLATRPEVVLVAVGPAEPLGRTVLPLLPLPEERGSDLDALLGALGRLWLAGARIDGERLRDGERRRRVSLPTYPFERHRFWIERRAAAMPGSGRRPEPRLPLPEPELPRCLVELRRGGEESPLFLVHPEGGQVDLYRDLAGRLGAGRPVYGIQSLEFEREGDPAGPAVEVMAARYVEAVTAVQAEGPYLLGGSSTGGMIAFEIAQQLSARGQRVDLLVLLDTPGPGQMPASLADPAFCRYVPQPYPGRIAYFRARSRRRTDPRHPEWPWIDVAAGGIDIHPLPGNPLTLHHPPHLEVLAEKLRLCLARAAASPAVRAALEARNRVNYYQ